MKVAFTTLGCRTNQNDTAEMQTLLKQEGFTIVSPQESADIYVVNSCTVTSKSDQSSRTAVKKSLAINEDALVVFTGCYAQTHPEEVSELEGLDVLLGNANKLDIAKVIQSRLSRVPKNNSSQSPLIHMEDIKEKWDFQPIPISDFHGKTKAFIKVQTGCDEACSFCTVVHARGRSISDSRKNIINNVKHAISSGYKEITLTGINLGTYGRDLNPPEKFSSLVKEILEIDGNFRVRLSSINPMEIDDPLIDLMAESPKLCPYFHIPLQSGDDYILEQMKRNYNSSQYRKTIERILNKIPNPGLGADIIVGFPGESDTMFKNTYKLVEDIPFSYLHVFSYSPRRGTTAHSLKNDVQNKTKKERNKILSQLGQNKSIAFRKSFLNKPVSLLVESNRDSETNQLKGHSENYIPIFLNGGNELMNQIISVNIQDVTSRQVIGCLP